MFTNSARMGAFILLLGACSLRADQAVINLDLNTHGPAVNPRLYGVFMEEISHAIDGGLYGELIRNRGFEDARPPEGYHWRNGKWVNPGGFSAGFERFGYQEATNGLPFWNLVQDGDARGTMTLETNGGITTQSAYCMRLDISNATGGRVGVANVGYFGIGVHEGETYSLSLYARGGGGFSGSLWIRLEDADGHPCSSEAQFKGFGSTWKQFKATIKGSRTVNKARLVIVAGNRGQLWLDFVSLFPRDTWKNRPNGLRADLAQLIADLKPGFVRFPGGCAVEAATVETAFNWKLSLGPVEQREERWDPWMYRATHGMGIYEYFQFIQDIGAEPLWVGFAGQTCIFRDAQLVPMDQMGWVRDGFLDLVEYANGDKNTKWGALRIASGQRAPFGLGKIEIGNENTTTNNDWAQRYDYVYSALKAKYPAIKYLLDRSWGNRRNIDQAVYDIEDQHYYQSTQWFLQGYHMFDNRDRKLPPLYLGELANTGGDAGPTRGNLRAALSEGIFMLGCERNADVVRMMSYAPLMGHVEGRTELTGAPPPWHAMIYFDGTRSYGTASYYLWKLMGASVPSYTVNTHIEYPDAAPVVVAGSVSVGAQRATAEFKDLRVEQDGKSLYAADFSTNATNATEGWRWEGNGDWRVEDDAYRVSPPARPGQTANMALYGEPDWSNYTFTVKARKLAGNGSVVLGVGARGNNRYTWNLGTAGNQNNRIVLNQTTISSNAPGGIETNRWYDLKVEVNIDHIRCYLDGTLVQEAVAPRPETFYAEGGRLEKTGEVILKAVNMRATPVAGTINLAGAGRVGSEGEITVLTSASLTDNNSLTDPKKVASTTGRIKLTGATFTHEFPANSMTVIRVPAK